MSAFDTAFSLQPSAFGVPVGPPAAAGPDAPVLTLSGVSSSLVQLSWGLVDGALTYRVYRATTTGGQTTPLESDLTGNTFEDTSVSDDGGPYYYVVTAVNDDGESVFSNEVSANPPGNPDPVTGLVMNAGGTNTSVIQVLWSDPSGGPSFTTVRIQLQEAGGDWSSPLVNDTTDPGTGSATVGGSLSPNTLYEVRVRTERATGNSTWEQIDVATQPNAPTLSVTNGSSGTFARANISYFEGDAPFTVTLSTDFGAGWDTPELTSPNTWEANWTDATAGTYLARASITNSFGLTSPDTTYSYYVTE